MDVAHPFSIRLFGSFEVFTAQSDEPVILRRKTLGILAYLAATGQPQSRQVLADLFCQDVKDPPGALRSILSRIRQRLGSEILLTEGNHVWLNQAISWVDSLEFVRYLESDLADLPSESLTEVVNLYHGEFLQNVTLDGAPEFELWLLNERRRHKWLYERGLGALISKLIVEDALESAIAYAQRLVQSDPLLEEAHGRLMWLYARSGQREAALAQYEQCRRLLQEELAVSPSVDLRSLYEEIGAGELRPARPSQQAIAELPSLSRQQSGFVGRTDEFEQLRAAWEESRRGHGPVVLIDAEAGMGKTRLVHELAASLPEADFLIGDCYESTRALPYSPWLELLERRLEQLDRATLGQLSALAADYLARLLPALARRLRQQRPPAPPTTGGEVSRLFAAIGEYLFQLPGTPPLLLFIDNLQWADEASLQLFHFLARHLPPGKALLVGALRSEEAANAPALQALLSDLQRGQLMHLPLSPLSAPAIAELITQLWPGLPEGYQPHVSNMLVRATGGNPFFISEILRELAGTTGVPSALPVPRSVGELIQRRLNELPEQLRQVVEALAVLDSPASLVQAQQISGRSEEETISAIDLALHKGFLHPLSEPSGAAATRYDFSHDIMREVVVGQLSHVRRQLLHRRAAISLEAAGAPAATLFHHWQLAGDREREGHYAALAGEQAAATYANEDAIRYLERALHIIADPGRRLQLMERLGDVQVLTGAWESAAVTFTEALTLAEATGSGERIAHFQSALGKLMSRKGLYPQALAWLSQARGNYEALEDSSGVANAVGTMGIVYWQQDRYDEALACYQQALDIETGLGNKSGIAVWTGNIGGIYNQRGDYERALTYMERSLRLRQELGMKLMVAIETGNIGNTYYAMGDYIRALEYHTQALQIRETLGDKAGIATVLGYLGRDYATLGEHETALACLQGSLRLNLELGNWEGIALQLGRIGELLGATGDRQGALTCLDRSVELFCQLGAPYYLSKWLTAQAELLCSTGEAEAAHRLNQEALAIGGEVSQEVEFSARLLAIRLQVALGELDKDRASDAFLALMAEFDSPEQRAALYYESWRLNPLRHSDRTEAANLYRTLYHQSYQQEYRQRYEQLTGESLPDPPDAERRGEMLATCKSELPAWLTAETVPLDVLLDQIDTPPAAT